MHLNRVNLIGRLAADPMLTKSTTGDDSKDRCWCRLAVSRKNRDGEESVKFIPFTCWGARARAVATHCSKGKELAVEGYINASSVQQDDGSYRNYFEVVATDVSFGADSKKKGAVQPAQESASIDMGMVKSMLEGLLKENQAVAGEDGPF